jgi:probable HAF family extracellular repeat protein
MHHKVISPVLLLVLLACVSSPLLAAEFRVIDLGTLGGGWYSEAQDVNIRGQAAGRGHLEDAQGALSLHAVRYDNPGLIDLGALEDPGNDSWGMGINDNGAVCGYSFTLDHKYIAFIHDGTGMQSLGDLGGGRSQAYAVNNSNIVVGYSMPTGSAIQHPFVWSAASGMTDLGTLGGRYGWAHDVNDQNQVVGYAGDVNDDIHAFLWTQASGMSDLGTLPGGSQSIAYGINEGGKVVGAATINSYEDHAFLWESGTGMVDLGKLPGSEEAFAYDINDRDVIVGASTIRISLYIYRDFAFIHRDGAMRNLNDLIPAGSGWELNQANAVNDRFQIAGTGRLNNDVRGFLLKPNADANDDDKVDSQDLGVFMSNWQGGTAAVDLDDSGSVDGADLEIGLRYLTK